MGYLPVCFMHHRYMMMQVSMVAHAGCTLTECDYFPTPGEPPKYACHVIERGLISDNGPLVDSLISAPLTDIWAHLQRRTCMNLIIPQAGDKSCAHHGAHKAGHHI